jgi:hypothetical protein
VKWMFLMMVINGGNMARKLSKTAFIQGKFINNLYGNSNIN